MPKRGLVTFPNFSFPKQCNYYLRQQYTATGGMDGPALSSNVHSEGSHNEFDWKIMHLHKGVVHESPAAGSLQDVVQVILKPPIAHISPAALRTVHQRLTE